MVRVPYEAEYKPPVTVMEDLDTELLAAVPSSQQVIELDLPPSCISFDYQNPLSCVVGTYYLEPQTTSDTTPTQQKDDQIERPVQNRRGSLTLFRFSASGEL